MNDSSTEEQPAVSGVKNSLKNAYILALFALLSTGLTALTWIMTKDRIQTEKELALLRAISELVPTKLYDNDPYRDCTLLTDNTLLGTDNPQQAWRLRDTDGKPVAALISSVAPNGYNGKIEIIVGHYFTTTNKTLAGVRVTDHKETPGLGDKISLNKSNWMLQFAGMNSTEMNEQNWQVKKDGGRFDAFTGATITPRAVLSAIAKNIEYFKQNQQHIFTAPANCIIDIPGEADD